jgi:hypothetical protein
MPDVKASMKDSEEIVIYLNVVVIFFTHQRKRCPKDKNYSQGYFKYVDNGIVLDKDCDGRDFVERDGTFFENVLDFLQNCSISMTKYSVHGMESWFSNLEKYSRDGVVRFIRWFVNYFWHVMKCVNKRLPKATV